MSGGNCVELSYLIIVANNCCWALTRKFLVAKVKLDTHIFENGFSIN